MPMPPKTLEITSKIILIYSFFYIGLKILVIFQGAWLEANLILALPFVLLALWGVIILRSGKFSWIYALVGILVVGLSRYFEKDWAMTIQSFFNS